MAMLGLRLGPDPRAAVTTTPKPISLLQHLIGGKDTALVRGSTYENRDNLARAFLEQIVAQYEGTSLGRQELDAEMLDDIAGALWRRQIIEDCRVDAAAAIPEMSRIVVAIDPAVGGRDKTSESGIVVAGIGKDMRGYVLADVSARASADEVARRGIDAFRYWQADRIVGEVNNGGEWIETVLRSHARTIPYRAVRASRGKQARAEPVAALYEQGRVHHVGVFAKLEDQMCEWVPGCGAPSPDRLDALVWCLTELMIGGQPNRVFPLYGH
jgi:phage terminase large subunit-like protein